MYCSATTYSGNTMRVINLFGALIVWAFQITIGAMFCAFVGRHVPVRSRDGTFRCRFCNKKL